MNFVPLVTNVKYKYYRNKNHISNKNKQEIINPYA